MKRDVHITAGTTIVPRELAIAAAVWLTAVSPGARRESKERVIRMLLTYVKIFYPEGYERTRACVEAQTSDRPLPKVKP